MGVMFVVVDIEMVMLVVLVGFEGNVRLSCNLLRKAPFGYWMHYLHQL